MTERKIIQALGLKEDWYMFSLDNGKEIKVWHDLEGVASWKTGDFIEYIDYDQLAKEVWESKGNISYSIADICDRDGRKMLKWVEKKFKFANKNMNEKLKNAILKKRFATLVEEILEQNPPIWNERREVRDWLIAKGVGDKQVCETLTSEEFHTFKIYNYKKQKEERNVSQESIEINNQEEIKKVENVLALSIEIN